MIDQWTTLTLAHAAAGARDFTAGLAHPLGGWDHLLAMLATGLFAARLSGAARLAAPAAFLAAMILSGALAAAGTPLPFVESGILASVLVLGLLVATASRMPAAAAVAVPAAFAVFHGHAHGSEMAPGGSFLAYAAGFVVSSAILLATGIGFGTLARVTRAQPLVRWFGAATALLALAVGVARL
jgi:urease accessory protein